MNIWPAWPGDRRQILTKLPLVVGILVLQCAAEYLIWEHFNATIAIIVTPIVAWWLLVQLFRWPWPKSSRLTSYPRGMAVALAFSGSWIGGAIAATMFGT